MTPRFNSFINSQVFLIIRCKTPFQKFDYYDPKQLGKYSIKSIYPALVGGSYEGMAISEGGQASREYARVTFLDSVTEEERRQVYDGLLEYCKLDTQAMIDILEVLRKKVLWSPAGMPAVPDNYNPPHSAADPSYASLRRHRAEATGIPPSHSSPGKPGVFCVGG